MNGLIAQQGVTLPSPSPHLTEEAVLGSGSKICGTTRTRLAFPLVSSAMSRLCCKVLSTMLTAVRLSKGRLPLTT